MWLKLEEENGPENDNDGNQLFYNKFPLYQQGYR